MPAWTPVKNRRPPEKAGVVVDWCVRAGVVRGLIAAQSDCTFMYMATSSKKAH